MITTAAAASLTPGALPAVTEPSFLNAGFSFDSASAVVSSRMGSSVPTTIGSPFRCGISIGRISSLNQPSRVACAALRWLSAA
jgi:hypothetical protein